MSDRRDASIGIGATGGLPEGGDVGQIIYNIAPGEGAWSDPGAVGRGWYVVPEPGVSYDSLTQILRIEILALPQVPGVAAFFLFAIPDMIERNRTDTVKMRLNDFGYNELRNRDGGSLVPSQLTPGQISQILYTPLARSTWRYITDLHPRPQDYRIWTGWTEPDGTTYTAANFIESSVSQPTPALASPAPPAPTQALIAAPVITGDFIFISRSGENGQNDLFIWEMQPDSIELGGVPCKVWRTNFLANLYGGNEVWTRQEYP